MTSLPLIYRFGFFIVNFYFYFILLVKQTALIYIISGSVEQINPFPLTVSKFCVTYN